MIGCAKSGSDMSISVHCRSRRDLEIRDLGNFFRVFLGNSTITVVRFNTKSTLNTNGSGSSGSNNTWSISTSTYSDSYNTWSISTLTLQWQVQYMVNINLDLAVAATIHGQYQPRLCSGNYNTWSISTSTLQWQLQYIVNINLDLQRQQQYMVNINLDLQCTMSQQVYTRQKTQYLQNCRKWAKNCLK
jgi:hypothetical protein